ncbi:MAG: protein translocase subunit SecD [Candidatus Harrisonbacteria bacterium]|nr:protein translocase subunit SecD [Candidatus Harrisonbacteria bacterium]
MRLKSFLLLLLILLVAVAAGLFVYPKSPYVNKLLPWRLGLDLVGGSQLIYEVDMSGVASGDRDLVIAGLRDVIERRVNLFGVSEPSIVTSKAGGSYRLLVELAGVKDISEAIKQIGETPFLFFAEVEMPESADKSAEQADLEKQPKFKPTELTGRYVKKAQLAFGRVGNEPQIFLEFTGEGAKIFEEVTSRNVGKPLAIFLDNNLLSAPRVSEKISGGRAQITGRFTIQEAKKLVERFNAGALPAPIKLVNQQTIGASLGQDSLQKMIWAGVYGTFAVMLFMLLYYHGLGFFAVAALCIYIVLTLAVFKLFSITMSLAGIAGFILSIGMAVDANILIFERTKEELRRGSSRGAAIDTGFNRAWTSIRDSNFTTILTSLILFYLTSSFVKGFALTLLIGVVMSMFSAITVTRTMLRAFSKL